MATATDLALSNSSRAFIFESGINRCGDVPTYFSCVSVDALTQDLGERTKVECPDPFNYGKYIEIGTIPGEVSRMTTSMTGRMNRKALSQFRTLAVGACSFDMQLHFGLCARPTDFNAYDKVLVMEDIFISAYNTDAIIALTSADVAEINETVDISIGNYYEIVSLAYAERGAAETALLTPIVDGLFADSRVCGGECGTASSGCDKAVVVDGDGLTLISTDAGLSWAAGQTMAGGSVLTNITGIDVTSGQLWSYNGGGEIVYAERVGYIAGTAVPATVTGLSTAGLDQDSGASYGLVVGTAGFVGQVITPSNGFSATPSAVTANNLTVVKFNTELDIALIGGVANTLIFTRDGLALELISDVPAAQVGVAITAVQPLTAQKWLIGYADGSLWCTDDSGVSWTQISLAGNTVSISDISFSSTHVVWATAGQVLYKSIDGGRTWVIVPENSNKSFATNGGMAVAIACVDNVNAVMSVGQDAGGAGMIIVGSPAN